MVRALIPALAAAALFAGPAWAQRSVDDIEDLIRDQRDAVDVRLFDELATHRSAEALAALEKVLGRQKKQAGLHAALLAFRLFAGAEVEPDAVAILAEQARKAVGAAAREVAARTLVALGDGARDELFALVEGSKDAVVRAVACDALAPWLGGRGSLGSMLLILENATLGSRAQQAYVGATHSDRTRYESMPHRAVITDVLSTAAIEGLTELYAEHAVARGTTTAWRLVLIDVLTPRQGEPVTEALLDLLEDREDLVVLAALAALDPREDWAQHDDELRPLLRRGNDAVRRAAVLRMGRFGINEPRWRDEVLKLARDKDAATRMGAAAVLADLRTPEAVEALHHLLADEAWPVRVEALEAVQRLRSSTSIPLLIQRLASERGRLRDDVHLALRLLTGEDHGRLPDRWQAWWEGEQDRFRVPSFDEASRRENERRRGGDLGYVESTFYGIHVTSERVTFVLDVSGSMVEPARDQRPRPGTSSRPSTLERTRLDVAKDELSEVLKKLPEDVFFNVIFFETELLAFSKELQRMKGAVRSKSLRYVRDQWPQGSTNLYGALELAFSDAIVDTIYVLSDGHPTHGELTDYAEIRARVGLWNAARKIRVHGVAVGVDSPLLEWLAEDTGGEYRRVD